MSRPVVEQASGKPKKSKKASNSATKVFLKTFLKKRSQVSSFHPSSPQLSKETCRYIDPKKPQVIVELGAGTGPITKIALEKMHPQSKLIAFELEAAFLPHLRESCPNAIIVQGDVGKLGEELDKLGVDKIDVVLSGLPTPQLPKALNIAMFGVLEERARDAYFSQITVVPLLFRGTYTKIFEQVKFKLVMANIPPGGVYHCKGYKPNWRAKAPGK
jgi:phospholipid N-methyltransferase